jgi:tetratricopeptide (TPR) repeat protein
MRKRNRSISGLMWLAAIVAGGLALYRGGPDSGLWAVYGVLLFLGTAVVATLWFVVVPLAALKLAGGDRDRQRRILRWVVNTPGPSRLKSLARLDLGHNERHAGRHEEAEATYRSILRDREGRLEPDFESVVRQGLADAIEALGRDEEAAAEREAAAVVLKGTDETVTSLRAQAQLLGRQHRHADAVALYERALELTPSWATVVRSEILINLVLSSYNAGRPADTVRWAEALIEHDPDYAARHGARRMAAHGYHGLGRPDEAERQARLAAETAPSADQLADSLATLADYAMKRGDLEEGRRLAGEAERALPGRKRAPWAVIAAIEELRGDYDEAIRALEHSTTIPMGHIPAVGRRADARADMELAALHAEAGRCDEALALIDRAAAEAARHPKLSIVLHSTAALVLALAGRRDEAMDRIELADDGRRAIPEDGNAHHGALALIGRAALLIGDPELAEAFLGESLDRGAQPVYRPYLWYHLAECRRRLGDLAGGREVDREAASTSFGTQWERLARERLAGEGVAV